MATPDSLTCEVYLSPKTISVATIAVTVGGSPVSVSWTISGDYLYASFDFEWQGESYTISATGYQSYSSTLQMGAQYVALQQDVIPRLYNYTDSTLPDDITMYAWTCSNAASIGYPTTIYTTTANPTTTGLTVYTVYHDDITSEFNNYGSFTGATSSEITWTASGPI